MIEKDGKKEIRDIENLTQWSEKWQLKSNINKYNIMHFGDKNIKHDYKMLRKPSSKPNEENDQDVVISTSTK